MRYSDILAAYFVGSRTIKMWGHLPLVMF